MQKKILNILQYIFFLALGLFLLWWTTKNLSPEEVGHLKELLKEANYVLVIPAMVMLLLSHYSRAIRWKILMDPLNIRPSMPNTFFAVMLGYFFNLFVPRLGEVMKCTILARYEKTPVDKVIGTMVAERACDVVSLATVIFLTVVLQINIVGEYASEELRKLFLDTSGNFNFNKLFIALSVIAAFILLFVFFLKRFSHIKPIQKINAIIKGIWQGLTSIRYIKKKGAFIFHSVFIWLMYLLSIRVGFFALESVSHLGMKPSLSVLSFGSIAMIITQGGIGAYQLAVQKTMTLYGISEVNGLAFGWLIWAVQTIMILVCGILSLLLLPVFNRKKNEAVPSHTQ
ncbi:MAG: lysylphosphatidylglycerol synthase transmembrane domain-containing protein [Chitinophagaceae bacterium]|nr:lysylphosphatidylglycerol synthase transmembrane domain-containing protein [Chitinophagaceae bacterium]